MFTSLSRVMVGLPMHNVLNTNKRDSPHGQYIHIIILSNATKAIGDQGFDIAETVDGSSKVATVVHEGV